MLVGYAVLVILTVTVVGYVLVSHSSINSLSRNFVRVNIPGDAAADRLIETLLAQDT